MEAEGKDDDILNWVITGAESWFYEIDVEMEWRSESKQGNLE